GPSGSGPSTTASHHAQPVVQSGATMAAAAPAVDQALARYPSFEHVVELIRSHRDVKLLVEVENTLRLAAYRPGRIEFTPTDDAPRDLAQRLGTRLQLWTGNRWAVTIVGDSATQTIAEIRDAKENALKSKAESHPLMQAVMATFPDAKILSIRTPEDIAAQAVAEALPEVEDEWDPFEDD
ncbi:MAG: DNA polymerase III subunit gamma/tau, partial [Sulfitobacter sp. SK025]